MTCKDHSMEEQTVVLYTQEFFIYSVHVGFNNMEIIPLGI